MSVNRVNMRCINCNINLHFNRRLLVLELDTRTISMIAAWIHPIIIMDTDYICQQCWEAANAIKTTANDDQATSSSGSNQQQRVGHSRVCLVCGRSVLRIPSELVLRTSPTKRQQQIYQFVMNKIAPREVHSTDRLCHNCYRSAGCKVAQIRSQEPEQQDERLPSPHESVKALPNSDPLTSQPSSPLTSSVQQSKLNQEMSAPTAMCRVCLAVDVRLLAITGPLQRVYEKITDTALHMADGRPSEACYMCYAQLKKCRKLMLTSARAEKLLNTILLEKESSVVDRNGIGLLGSLQVSGREYFETQVPSAVVIKPEPETEVSDSEIGDVSPEDVSYRAPLAAAADIHDTECGSDEDDPGALSPPADTRLDIKQELEEEAGSTQTSEADKRKQVKRNRTNKKQRESRRESTTRTAPRLHQCEVCQQRFRKKNSLTNHLRTHIRKGPYECNVCQKLFRTNNKLQIHLSNQNGEKPFQCNICDRRFSLKCNLLTHIRTHTEEKPFQCKVCNSSFNGKSNLLRHIRTHTGEKPYQCDMCDSRFNRKGNLLTHIRTHTGEKPFQCKVCQKAFSERGTLSEHLKAHTGEKPYQCKVCQHQFSYKRNLMCV